MNTFFAETANVSAPATAKELADLVAGLHAAATPWLPCGLGSRLQWGPPVEMPSQPISVSGLQRILDHAVDDLTITVEAGLPLADLQMVLKEHHQWLAVNWPRGSQANTDPNSAGSVGGLVARGLAGGLRQRHLGIRDQLIGIGLLRSDGIAAHAGGRVVKNVAGYDLMRLLCGSWGSLALITELTLRCQPIRQARKSLRLDGSLEALEAWRAELLRTSFTPEYCDWIKTDSDAWHLKIGVA
ncbi:MAG TPA: FAD-binding oxidoreductase, partial [Prochlorococcus sp.]|nr:FAD-binding oxidoreductase [Prochlorococcus sp.]